MPDRHVKWKPGAKNQMAKSFKMLVDDNVHLVGSDRESVWFTMACYKLYQSTLTWTFDPTDEPVTCLFCLAGEPRF